MGQYIPPLRDIQFVMHELLDTEGTLKEMPAHAGEDPSPSGQLLPRESRRNEGELYRSDETGDRQSRGSDLIRETIRDGRASVREYPAQQAAQSLHVARAKESRHAVETLLPRPQHRETRASRLRAVGRKGRKRLNSSPGGP